METTERVDLALAALERAAGKVNDLLFEVDDTRSEVALGDIFDLIREARVQLEALKPESAARPRPHVYDWRAMRPGSWRTLAETMFRADLLLTVEQAARALGVNPDTLTKHCAKGWLPSYRRPTRYGAQRGLLLIRRSDLRHFRWRRPELVGVSGRKRRAA